MDRARLRQIIKEELYRAVNEGEGMGAAPDPTEVRSIVRFFNSGYASKMAAAIGGLSEATPENVLGWLTGSRAQQEGFDGYSHTDLRAAAQIISDRILGQAPSREFPGFKTKMRQHYEQNIEDPYGPEVGYRDDY
jgi:hypothetical protein